MMKRPLEGIRVIGFTWHVTGPQLTKILAANGAQVISIEGRRRVDPQRTVRPFKDDIPGLNRAGDFNQYNAGKLSIALNLAHPGGMEIARKLISVSDVVVENFAGGVMEKIGLGYEELKKLKPDIIMLSTSMQGQNGPYAGHPGTGYQLAALSGFYPITGWPDRLPVGPDGPYPDFVAPRFGVLAVMAALLYRRRTGRGQYLDLSQYETAVHYLSPLVLDYAVNGRVAGPVGNRASHSAPHGAFRCKGDDRWCAIAVSSDGEWESFCRVIGRPAWTADTRFNTFLGRKQNEDELERLVEVWTLEHTDSDVMRMMQAEGVPAGMLQTGEDLLEHDPQLKHRNLFRELDHPEVGMYRAAGPAFIMSKTESQLTSAPLLGEHNEYILKEVLGLSDDEVAELVIEGVIE